MNTAHNHTEYRCYHSSYEKPSEEAEEEAVGKVTSRRSGPQPPRRGSKANTAAYTCDSVMEKQRVKDSPAGWPARLAELVPCAPGSGRYSVSKTKVASHQGNLSVTSDLHVQLHKCTETFFILVEKCNRKSERVCWQCSPVIDTHSAVQQSSRLLYLAKPKTVPSKQLPSICLSLLPSFPHTAILPSVLWPLPILSL